MKVIQIFTEVANVTKSSRNAALNSQFILNQNSEADFFIIPFYNNIEIKNNLELLYTDEKNNYEVFSAIYNLTGKKFILIKPLNQFYPFFNHDLKIHNCLNHFIKSVYHHLIRDKQKLIIHLHSFLLTGLVYIIKANNLENIFKTIFTLNNLKNDLVFFEENFLELSSNNVLINEIRRNGAYTLIKCGLLFADVIVLKSRFYSVEVQKQEFGGEYHQFFIHRSDAVYGIMNGVQYSVWNPKNDKMIQVQYDIDNLQNKIYNKLYLQKKISLTQSENIPFFFYGTRLDDYHGFELLINALEEISELPMHLLIHGTGDEDLIIKLEESIRKYHNVRFIKGFSLDSIHEFLAGSEFIIIPNIIEPDGVSFLYAFKYGLVPVAHKTGGLRDAIIDISQDIDNTNGFFFSSYYSESLVEILQEAISVYKDKSLWLKYQTNVMQADWSWKNCIKQYVVLYQKLWQ